VGIKLAPRDITTMTESKALGLVHRTLTQQTLDHDDAELKSYLHACTPKISLWKSLKKVERRKDMFGTVTGFTMTATVKTETNLYCIEQDYEQLSLCLT